MSPAVILAAMDDPVAEFKSQLPLVDLDDRSCSFLLDRNSAEPPIEIQHAKGHWLFTSDGREILDGSGGASVASIGHGDARVAEAVNKQMARVAYVSSAMFSTSSPDDFAEYVAKPAGFAKMYLCGSGSEAMEAAMKLGRQYFEEIGQTQKTNFIARDQSYHGTTLGALNMSGHRARRKHFEPYFTPTIHRVSSCNPYRQRKSSETDANFVSKKAAELERKLLEVGPKTVIGFVCEPISGATLGCVPYVPGYLAAMKAVCVKFGVLFILDEVMCGMGRSGTLHAWQAEHSDEPGHDCRPDLQTVAKGLGGGYQPVAGLLIGKKIVAAIDRGSGIFASGHTYQSHPVACAGALRVQQIVEEDGLLPNVQKQGAYLCRLLHHSLDSHPHVGDIRGMGLFWGIEFVLNRARKEPFDPGFRIAKRVQKMALSEKWNLAIYMGQGTVDGVSGDHVIISPAFNVTSDIVDLIVERIVGAIHDVFDALEMEMELNGAPFLGKATNGLTSGTSRGSSCTTSALNASSSGEDE